MFDLEAFLYREIPLVSALRLRAAREPDGTLVLRAPIAGNHNDKATAFAGSLYSVAALAAWGWITSRLHEDGLPLPVAVYEANIRYLRPVTADFEARCAGCGGDVWAETLAQARGGKRARLALEVEIRSAGETAARFAGRYALLPQ